MSWLLSAAKRIASVLVVCGVLGFTQAHSTHGQSPGDSTGLDLSHLIRSRKPDDAVKHDRLAPINQPSSSGQPINGTDAFQGWLRKGFGEPTSTSMSREQGGRESTLRTAQYAQDQSNATEGVSPARGTASDAPPDTSVDARLSQLRRPLSEIRIGSVGSSAIVPPNQAAVTADQQTPLVITASGMDVPRPQRYTAGFRHRPLYFEQPTLERCGGAFGYLQNPISGIQFLTNTVLLPYRMCAIPYQCTVAAGGDCEACQVYQQLPAAKNADDSHLLDCKAFGVEAAALAGFSFLLL